MRALRLTFAGMAILALTVGTTGVAVAQAEATEDAVPAVVTESPSPMTSEVSSSGIDAFPTGYFVSVDRPPTGPVMLEFHGDGTAMTHHLALDNAVTPFTYVIDGDVYTHIASEFGDQPTYRWDYDGGRLTFELVGEETCSVREARYSSTFRSIEGPRVVMVAARDLEVGDPIWAFLDFLPGAEVCPDAYANLDDVSDRVAAVPISMGQPITPDMLEPLPAE